VELTFGDYLVETEETQHELITLRRLPAAHLLPLHIGSDAASLRLSSGEFRAAKKQHSLKPIMLTRKLAVSVIPKDSAFWKETWFFTFYLEQRHLVSLQLWI
jgi:hypothetical protein